MSVNQNNDEADAVNVLAISLSNNVILRLGHTELTEILSVSDIGNKWFGKPFKNRSVQCGHFCIFLCELNLSKTKSDWERIPVSSVWPSR